MIDAWIEEDDEIIDYEEESDGETIYRTRIESCNCRYFYRKSPLCIECNNLTYE